MLISPPLLVYAPLPAYFWGLHLACHAAMQVHT